MARMFCFCCCHCDRIVFSQFCCCIVWFFIIVGCPTIINAQWNRVGYTQPPPQRIPQFSSYGSHWGHYPPYDPKQRPIESWDPYSDYNRRGYGSQWVTPNPNPGRRRLIEDPGDTRCKEAITSDLDEFVTVNTMYGNVVGRIVYLCDGPLVPERDRPIPTWPSGLKREHLHNPQYQHYKYQSNKYDKQYRPIRYFWRNSTAFLGVPYAKPPTRENNLRFRVRIVCGRE